MSYQRDEIIRAALKSIDAGVPVHQAITDAVDSALEFAALETLNTPEHPMRKALTEKELTNTNFITATRRQLAPEPLPTGKHKESDWWKL